jgi:hypothetical protein
MSKLHIECHCEKCESQQPTSQPKQGESHFEDWWDENGIDWLPSPANPYSHKEFAQSAWNAALAARPQEQAQPDDVRTLKEAVIAAVNQYGDTDGYVKAKYIQDALCQQASQPSEAQDGIRALNHKDVCQLSRMFNTHGLFSSQITRINEALKQEIQLSVSRAVEPPQEKEQP